MIFTKRGIDLTAYKAITQHLSQFKTQLEPRPANWDSKKGEWPGRKPGPYQWYEIQDTVAYYEDFEKPKIIFPDIAKGCTFALDMEGFYSTNTTYMIPIDVSQKYLVPLLNSSLIEFFFRTISALIRGDYLRFFTQSVVQIPIRRIHFTTPVDERNRLAHEALALYTNNKREELLTFVETCLAQQTEQSDVVHDVLAYLAERMIELNQQRYKAVTDFIFDLQAELSDTQFQKINRLWTPPSTAKIENSTAEKQQSEAVKMLGPLVERQLDLRNDIGKLYEEQWIWLLRNKLNGGYSLANLVRAYRTYQPLIAGLDKHILATDRLIDEIVYRLYGLTQEERAGIEELRNG